MRDRPRHVLWLGRADRALPIADTDHATGFGNAGDFVVGQVAVDLAGRLDAAEDHRARRHRQHFGNRPMAGMGQIDDHSQGLHAAHHFASERREPAFCDAMHRPGDVVVEEMGETRHSKTDGVQHVEIGDKPSIESMPPTTSASRRSISTGVLISRSRPPDLSAKPCNFFACHSERSSSEVHVRGGCSSVTVRFVMASVSAPLES